MAEFVRLEVDGGIGVIRLERPPMNALNMQVQEEIRAASAEATRRDDVRAVIVYGGQKVFALHLIQARDPRLVGRPFFAQFDPGAVWLSDLRPAFADRFPFDSEDDLPSVWDPPELVPAN